MKRLKPAFEHEDERGIFKELIRGDKWKELNYAMRKKGVNSGNHYHKIAEEFFYVIRGKVKVNYKNVKTGKEDSFSAEENDIFIVEPYDLHNLEYFEDTEFAILLSVPFDKDNPDLFEAENEPEKDKEQE